MFEFLLFFLILLPVTNFIRQSNIGKVEKLLITGLVTSSIGFLFVYTSVLASKFFRFSNQFLRSS